MTKQKQVAITTNKRGQQVAYRLDTAWEGYRWFRIGLDDANLMLATEKARQVPFTANR